MSDKVPVRLDVTGLHFVMFLGQADRVADIRARTDRSASVAQVACSPCGAALADLLEPLDADGNQLPYVVAVHVPLRPGTRLVEVDSGQAITITRGQLETQSRGLKKNATMTAPHYVVADKGMERLRLRLECGHHGDRGSVTIADLEWAASTGRRIRR